MPLNRLSVILQLLLICAIPLLAGCSDKNNTKELSLGDYYDQVTSINKAIRDGLQPASRELLDKKDSGPLERILRTAVARLESLSEPSEVHDVHARHIETLTSFANYLRSTDGEALDDMGKWLVQYDEVVQSCRDLRRTALDHDLRPEIDCLYYPSESID